jgi:hypothetical protein
MPAGASSILRWVCNVAKSSIYALHAVHQPGFLEVLQRPEDRHTIDLGKKVRQLTM